MRLIKQDKPQCLLYAFAMAFGATPQEMINFIGHDGMDIWWPNAVGEKRLRGFHHQEMVDYGFRNGHCVIMVEAMPNLGWNGHHRVIMEGYLQGRMNTYLQTFDGVLTSDKHAVAWCHEEQKCYDPNGYIYGIDNFSVREFFITIKEGENGEITERLRRTLQRVGTAEADAGLRTGTAGGETTPG
jgi:hypothetical protein